MTVGMARLYKLFQNEQMVREWEQAKQYHLSFFDSLTDNRRTFKEKIYAILKYPFNAFLHLHKLFCYAAVFAIFISLMILVISIILYLAVILIFR